MSTNFWHHLQLAKALGLVYQDNLERLMEAEECYDIMLADHATEHAENNFVKHTVKVMFGRVIRRCEAEEAREVEVRCLLFTLSTSSDGHTLAETVQAGHMSAS